MNNNCRTTEQQDRLTELFRLLTATKKDNVSYICNCCSQCNPQCNYPQPIQNQPTTNYQPTTTTTTAPTTTTTAPTTTTTTTTTTPTTTPTNSQQQPTPPPPEPKNTFPLTPSIGRATNVGAPCIEDATLFALTVAGNKGHDPDGVGWITPAQWQAARWNGVPIDICGMTFTQMKDALFPGANTMLGLREVFYAMNPFADNRHPTVPEIDNWNIRVIQHLRDLVGAKQKVSGLQCLFLEAQFASERQNSRAWDTPTYPGTCLGDKNPHCGAGFFPNASD